MCREYFRQRKQYGKNDFKQVQPKVSRGGFLKIMQDIKTCKARKEQDQIFFPRNIAVEAM